MNTINLISYASGSFSRRRATFEAEAIASQFFNNIKTYSEEDLDRDFYNKYQDIFTGRHDPYMPYTRGGGFWIWKPFIIKRELHLLKEGDILVYADIGCTIQNNTERHKERFYEYVELAKKHDILFFELTTLTERMYSTKRLTEKASLLFPNFNVDSDQRVGGIVVINNNSKTREFYDNVVSFIEEDPLIITDSYNRLYQQDPRFIDHRHDQSIMSILSKGYEIGYTIPDETWLPEFNDIAPIRATRKRS